MDRTGVKRRAFLGGAAGALSVGVLGRRALAAEDPLVVRVWQSERAAGYDGLVERLRGYLVAALEPVVGPIDVERGAKPVSLPREGGRRVLGWLWTRLVAAGALGVGPVDPVDGVNLLVTDGDPTNHPAGFARPRVAATTGAAAIARMPPADETASVVPYSVPAAATQVVLHECGHALGFTHDQGSVTHSPEGVVASPMVGSYFWASESVRERHLDEEVNACGDAYPTADGADRRLRLRFADCVSRPPRR